MNEPYPRKPCRWDLQPTTRRRSRPWRGRSSSLASTRKSGLTAFPRDVTDSRVQTGEPGAASPPLNHLKLGVSHVRTEVGRSGVDAGRRLCRPRRSHDGVRIDRRRR